jgi:hypothetical protein
MKTYARIQDGRVAELLTTQMAISDLFHPSLLWVDITDINGIKVGWGFDGFHFQPVDLPQPTASTAVSIADLQHRMAELSAQIATLVTAAEPAAGTSLAS